MNTILVVGVDTTVGANAASRLSDRHSIVGLAPGRRVAVENCECHEFDASNSDEAATWLADVQPERVLYCGPESRSCWEPAAADQLTAESPATARAWAAATKSAGIPFTMISSDAVFAGPWIFHDEESLAVCRSPQAAAIREAEKLVGEACPEALIIRTNVFGWSPTPQGGWIENLLSTIENSRTVDCDAIRHATPILAADLIDIVERAWNEELSGVYHVGGAERISPIQFAQRLADQFDLPWLAIRREQSLVELPQGFGAGETSLQTKKIRKALCVAMPMLSEGLRRLTAQRTGTDAAEREPARVARVA